MSLPTLTNANLPASEAQPPSPPPRLLTDEQWQRIAGLLPGKVSDRGRTAMDNRLFVDAILYVASSGCRWRNLPLQFGHAHSTYVRFLRWDRNGVWDKVAQALSHDVHLAPLFIETDSGRTFQRQPGRTVRTLKIARRRTEIA